MQHKPDQMQITGPLARVVRGCAWVLKQKSSNDQPTAFAGIEMGAGPWHHRAQYCTAVTVVLQLGVVAEFVYLIP